MQSTSYKLHEKLLRKDKCITDSQINRQHIAIHRTRTRLGIWDTILRQTDFRQGILLGTKPLPSSAEAMTNHEKIVSRVISRTWREFYIRTSTYAPEGPFSNASPCMEVVDIAVPQICFATICARLGFLDRASWLPVYARSHRCHVGASY